MHKRDMRVNKNDEVHLGDNIKHLMKAFSMTQSQLADKLGMPDSHLCNLLHKANMDDASLQKIAEAIGYGVSVDMIRNYNHDDTIQYIINNYTQHVEDGGTGTLIPNQEIGTSTTFEGGSSQTTNNNYVAEQAFAFAEKNAKLEKLLLYYRMKMEPEAVEKEMEALKKEYDQTKLED